MNELDWKKKMYVNNYNQYGCCEQIYVPVRVALYTIISNCKKYVYDGLFAIQYCEFENIVIIIIIFSWDIVRNLFAVIIIVFFF